MELTEKQSLSIRYIQAIGIIFVVIGHYPIKLFSLFSPYAFHMPLFFLLGGLLYKNRNYSSLVFRNIKKHGGYIVVTYIIISVLVIIMNKLYGISVSKIYLESGIFDTVIFTIEKNFHNNTFFLVAWFLFSYMIISIIAPVLFLIKNKSLLLLISLTIGFIAIQYLSPEYHSNKIQSLNLTIQVCVGLMYYTIGYVFKNKLISSKSLIGIIVSFLILIAISNNGEIKGMGIAWSVYSMGFLIHLVVSILCIYIIFNISNIMSEFFDKINLIFLIGKYSRSIISYHLFSFLIVDVIFYYLGMYEIKNAGALSHYSNNKYFLLYASFGIFLPLCFGILINKLVVIKNKFINRN